MKKPIRLWRSVAVASALWVASHGVIQAEGSRINLQNTEIRTLVQTVSKLTGKNFIIDPAVRGNITFVSGDGLSKDELYEAFLSILQVHGLEAIEVGNVTKIVPLNKGRSQVAPIIETPPPPKPGQPAQQPQQKQPKIEADRTVTQVFSLQYIPVNTAIQTLQPLAGQGETRIQFNQASNAVIVTGRKQNVDRLAAVIRSIDKPNNQGFELVALRHSVASQLANTLRGLMASGKTADGGAIPQRVYISVDERTNSILVAGDKADRERMRQVIAKLDIPRTVPPATVVVKIRYADANQLVQTLRQLQIAPANGEGGNNAAVKQARIAVDKSTNSIIISGEREDQEPIMAAIKRLDVPPDQPPDTQVVRLQHADAAKLLDTLRQLQITPTKEGDSAIKQARLALDESTNSIIIAGDRQDRAPILAAIKRLDVPRTQPQDTQVVPVRYAVASQIIQVLKQLQIAPAEGSQHKIRLAADERTNSVLISGKHADRLPIIAAIRKLDTPKSRAGGTRVVRLRYAQAEEIVSVLTQTAQSMQQQAEGTAAAAEGGTPAVASSSASQVSIQADKATNSVIITAPEHLQVSIGRVIAQLDQRRPQVMVEAIIAEVSTDLSNQFGFGVVANGAQNGGTGVAGYSNFGGLNTALSLFNGATSIPGGFLLGMGNNKFGLVLEALKGDAATNILSTPTLVTLDNEEASIVVGQNVPFVTGSYTNSTGSAENPFQTIQRQDVGLTLKVKPQINRDRTITMKIEQEVSSIASSSAASDVITNKRSINTNVMVEDGQVLVLGGLIQDDFRDSETKVPILSDLPIIGGAFRENTTTKTKQNLMAFIHPVILPDRAAADAYTRGKYHTLQKQQQQSKVLQRGSLTGNAAVFPNIECAGGHCAKVRSVDDLHFSQHSNRPRQAVSQSMRHPFLQNPPQQVNSSAFDNYSGNQGQQ